MSDRSTDILDARQQPRRRATAIGEGERRQRAAVAARRLPPAVESHSVPVSSSPTLLTEDQRRRRASYSLPGAVLRQKTIAALRSELSPEVTDVARRFKLHLLATRALQVVHHAQRTAGGQFIEMPRARVAEALGIAPERAGKLIDGLRQIGALETRAGALGSPMRYRVNL